MSLQLSDEPNSKRVRHESRDSDSVDRTHEEVRQILPDHGWETEGGERALNKIELVVFGISLAGVHYADADASSETSTNFTLTTLRLGQLVERGSLNEVTTRKPTGIEYDHRYVKIVGSGCHTFLSIF